LLARREHSARELQGKLRAREFGADAVAGVITQLQREGLQSDRRFTESYIHSRVEKGYGPVRIKQELREKGLDNNLIEVILEGAETDWLALAARIRARKFGATRPANFREQARQARFLQYRGFTSDQIRSVFKTEHD